MSLASVLKTLTSLSSQHPGSHKLTERLTMGRTRSTAEISLLGILFLAAACSVTGTTGIKEYCSFEPFNATCDHDSVVMMTSAKYGRMRLGRCIDRDYMIGCSADVIAHADVKCSGRQRCSFILPDGEMHKKQPCAKDLAVYFEAAFECVKVETGNNHICHAYKPLVVTSSSGYISSQVSYESGYGTDSCPWRVQAKPGQTLNVTLYDFGSLHHRIESNRCQVYAKIRDLERDRDETICSSTERVKQVFMSTSTGIEIKIVRHSLDVKTHFLLHYQAVGCANIPPPVNGWVKRTGDKAVIGCNYTNARWHVVCKGTEWTGPTKNCSREAWMINGVFGEEETFPYGLLVSVIIGVFLGIIMGSSMLALVLSYRRRRERKLRELNSMRPPYPTGTLSESGYTRSNQKYAGLTGSNPSTYAHIWELRGVDQTNTPSHPATMPAFYPRDPTGMTPSAEVLDNMSNTSKPYGTQKRKEHIYESPKFNRKSSSTTSYCDGPYYHEFDPGVVESPDMAPSGEHVQQCRDRCSGNSYST